MEDIHKRGMKAKVFMHDPFKHAETDELYQRIYDARIDAFICDQPHNLQRFLIDKSITDS